MFYVLDEQGLYDLLFVIGLQLKLQESITKSLEARIKNLEKHAILDSSKEDEELSAKGGFQ